MHDEYVCTWRENYWKYDEIKRFMALARAANGGLDLNRMEGLGFIDFIKLGILSKYYKG